jgi:hypothetical protein
VEAQGPRPGVGTKDGTKDGTKEESMAIWKYQTATCEPKDLQMSLDEMAKMGWDVITVLVQ